MAKPKKQKSNLVEKVVIPIHMKTPKITPLSEQVDLNVLRDKINEIIKHINA